MAFATYLDAVQKLYIAFYQRPADPAGLRYWAQRVDAAGGDQAAAIDAFATSAEAQALYGTITKDTIGTVIDKIYMALFNKAPDAAGKQFYVDGFTAGTFTAGTIALNVLNGASNDDAVAVANKLGVANEFTKQVDGRALTNPDFGTGTSFNATYSGDADSVAARDILKAVTASPATVLNASQVTDAIKTKIADATDPIIDQTGGQTFTLTVGNDVADTTSAFRGVLPSDFKFSAGNETINSSVGTLNAGDIFLDATTTDNDVLNTTLAAASGLFTAQNVETINANFVNAAADLNLGQVSGVKAINVAGSTAGLVSNFAAATVQPTIGVKDYTNTLTVQATTFAGTTALGTAETVNLSVEGASWGTTAATQTAIVVDSVAGGALETLNIKSAGTTANVFGLAAGAGDAFSTINVTGTADATIRVTNANISGVTVKADGNTGTTTLSVDRTGVAAASTNLTNVSGVEKVEFRDAANAAALVATNVAANVEISAVNSFAGGSSIAVFGAGTNAADKLKLTLDHTTANTATVIGGLDVQSVETLDLVSNGNSAATVAAANGNNLTLTGDFTAINVSGDTTQILNFTRDAVTTAGTSNAVVDASGLTGTAGANITVIAGGGAATETFTVTGTANADTIVGGAEGNTLNGGAGNDTITGGALIDTISGGDGNDRVVSTADADVITTGAGVDTIAFGANDVDVVAVQITDFATGNSATARDVVEIDNAVGFGGVAGIVANLANGQFAKGTAAAVAAADNTIIVITDTAYANFAAAEAAVEARNGTTDDYALVFLNSTTGFAELWVDADSSAAGAGVQLATFQNITTLIGVADFDTANFTVV